MKLCLFLIDKSKAKNKNKQIMKNNDIPII